MKIKVHTETKLSGHYEKIEVLRADGSLKQEHAGFSNLIVDGGIARLAEAGNVSVFNFCRVGTGSATPTEFDNNLQSQIASTATSSYEAGNNLVGGYAAVTIVYTFALGAVVGNISEVATGWAASGINTIFSRARILDGNGNPTTITIQSDEILRVTWTHRRYWPSEDMLGILTNAGNKGGSYSWRCRASRVGSWVAGRPLYAALALNASTNSPQTLGYPAYYSGVGVGLGSIADDPLGTVSVANAFTASTVGIGATSTIRLTFSTTQGNITGGISVFKFGTNVVNASSAVQYQIEFTPALLKTVNDLMEIEFSHSWGRR